MDIKDYLSPENVVIGKDFAVKRRLFETICEYAGSVNNLDKIQLLEKLLERERIGSTYLGNGCACPLIAYNNSVAPSPNYKKVFGFLTILGESIDYDPPHRQLVDIVFLLIGFDKVKAKQALDLSRFRLDAPWIRQELRQAKTSEEAYNIITGPIKPCCSRGRTADKNLAIEETDLDDMVPEFSTPLLS